VFFDDAHGGRSNPPVSGFHPQVDIRGTHTSCVVESLSGDEVLVFGEPHRVSLKLMFPDQYPNAFAIGDKLNFYEGHKLIGTGEVMEA
jgi:translation elongation factor EF-Tu-like GTPase